MARSRPGSSAEGRQFRFVRTWPPGLKFIVIRRGEGGNPVHGDSPGDLQVV